MGKYNTSYSGGTGSSNYSNVLNLNGPSWMQPVTGVGQVNQAPNIWGQSKVNITDPCAHLNPGTGAYLACKNSTAGGTSPEDELQAQADAAAASDVRRRHSDGEWINSSAYSKYVAPYRVSSIWD